MKPWQRSGSTGFWNEANVWACTGSMMGRHNVFPDDRERPIKLRMQRVGLVCGDYDQGGAYWGGGPGTRSLFCAYGEDAEHEVIVYVRAYSREEARREVVRLVPGARFYR